MGHMNAAQLLSITLLTAACSANAAAETAWPQEPKEFKSVPFNASKAHAKELQPDLKCNVTCELKVTAGDVFFIVSYSFVNDRMVEASGYFTSRHYQALRNLFIEKYGEPHETKTLQIHNRIGSAFPMETMSWQGVDLELTMLQYTSSLNSGAFVFRTREYANATKKVEDKSRSSALR